MPLSFTLASLDADTIPTQSKRTRHAPPRAHVMRVRTPSGHVKIRKIVPLNILMIEDSQSDAMLTRMTLNECTVPGKITEEITDGNSALAFLRKNKFDRNGYAPDAIFLDLGLPDRSGFEVLAEISEDKKLSHIPIIILTGFSHYEYLKNAYQELYIAAYLTKPCTVTDMEDALNKIVSRKYR